MQIPNGAIVPLYIVSFILLSVQYYRINPDRRVFNTRFGLMTGAIVLMFLTVFQADLSLSPILFVLGLLWLGLSLYLMRLLPPPRH